MTNASSLWRDIQKIRAEAPLVHNITNYVVMNTTANALLAIGASPVMAHAIDEVEEMVGIARALVINIGTLSQPWIDSMIKAAKAAKKRAIPVVLDPSVLVPQRCVPRPLTNSWWRRHLLSFEVTHQRSVLSTTQKVQPKEWIAHMGLKRHSKPLVNFQITMAVPSV